MLDDAALALEKIAPPDKDRVEVLGVHLALELIGRKWPDNVIIMLNLASYASVTGRTEEAKVRLRRAIKLDRGVRQLALEVADLRPLWDWISRLD